MPDDCLLTKFKEDDHEESAEAHHGTISLYEEGDDYNFCVEIDFLGSGVEIDWPMASTL